MTITVQVIEVLRQGKTVSRGKHEFVQLPSTGDRLVLQNAGFGETEVVKVLCVEHSPVLIPKSPVSLPDPSVSLIVKLVETLVD